MFETHRFCLGSHENSSNYLFEINLVQESFWMFLQGLGCTYSFCGKYESCADCVTDPFCGWCDSSRSCLGGFAAGPPVISCPAWFYHHCYTVGDELCSHDIMVGEE